MRQMNDLYNESKMILVNQAAIMSTLNLLLSIIPTIPTTTRKEYTKLLDEAQKQSLMLSEMCALTNQYVTEFVDKNGTRSVQRPETEN
jgi:hypothetical protein